MRAHDWDGRLLRKEEVLAKRVQTPDGSVFFRRLGVDPVQRLLFGEPAHEPVLWPRGHLALELAAPSLRWDENLLKVGTGFQKVRQRVIVQHPEECLQCAVENPL